MKTDVEIEWRDISGYETHYQVNNLGEVRSLDRIITTSNGHIRKVKGRALKPILIKRYLSVHLVTETLDKSFRIHRLVALAFHENTKNKPQVNHIDGNKLNNRADNLEWCTASENMKHACRLGLVIPPSNLECGIYIRFSRSVINCRGEEFKSTAEAAKAFGLRSKRVISKACKDTTKSAGKYIDTKARVYWRYLKDI